MANIMDRRSFLRNAGIGLSALTSGWSGSAVASPYGMPIGLQLFTVRDHLQKDLEGTLKQVAAIGYREVELGASDYYGRKPGELRRMLDGLGLRPISTHFSEAELQAGVEKRVATAQQCGITYIGLGSLEEKDRSSLAAVRRDAEWFNKVGKAVEGAGCHFFYHGHNFDYATLDGAVLYDELIRNTDPQFVNFELDCFWCVRAGKDPLDYFRRFPGRFPQLHIKDLKPGYPPTTGEDSRPGAFTEVGQGIIDWKKIFRAAKAGGLKHFYVEQDECDRDSLESSRISYDYLHDLSL